MGENPLEALSDKELARQLKVCVEQIFKAKRKKQEPAVEWLSAFETP